MDRDPVELAQSCLDGDVDALREFVECFQQQVFALCLRMLGHRQDAEDITQESLLRAVRYLRSWNPEQPLAPWIMKIAANRCRTALSKRQRTPIPQSEMIEPTAASLPRLGLGEELQRALDLLDEPQRTCFILFYQQEMSIAEVSQAMDVAQGTIKTWLHRSRKKLAERLRERGY